MPYQSLEASSMLDAYLLEHHTVAERHLATEARAKTDGQVSGADVATRSSKAYNKTDARAVKKLDKQMHEMTDVCMLREARKLQESLDGSRGKA